jgi:sugar/nucleoside kinase (ribokinase family)
MGDVALDVIAQLKEQINYGNDTASKISTHPGGQAANVATWITRTNNKSVIVARVGNDPVGFALVSDLDKYGVEHHKLMNSGRPSGVVVILVDSNGERTMFPDNGANADLEVSDLPPLDDIDGVFLSGYALLDFRSRDAALGMIKKFHEKKIPIFFDPTTTGAMKAVPKEEILDWVGMVDGILLNNEEARYLGESDDLEEAEENLRKRTPLVVIKLGSRGATGIYKDQFAKVPAVTTNVVDTTGAGDSFAAGFIPKWLETSDLEQALNAGTALAAKCVATVGARPPLN